MTQPTAKPYWSPYLAGTGLGLVLLMSYIVMGQGLGASGGLARFLYTGLHFILPEHVEGSAYMGKYFSSDTHPLNNYLVFLVLGVFSGGLISGLLTGRVKKIIEKGPNVSSRTRLILAFGGGTLMGFAARLARGCASGQALTGGATMALGSWVFMIALFVGGYATAWFVRRQWQ